MAKVWPYLKLALNTASKDRSRVRKSYRLGAIAIRRDGTIVTAQNGLNYCPNQKTHAESRVLKKAGQGAILFVSRIARDGSIRMARPCPKCLKEIQNRKVYKVYYTISNHEYGCITFKK